MTAGKRIAAALAALATAAVSLLSGAGPAGATEDDEQPFAVTCESVHHDVHVDFLAGTATGDGQYSVCVSATHPTIVRGELMPLQGQATGNPGDVTILIPHYRVKWLDAQADEVLTTDWHLTLRYTGPVPNTMIGQLTVLTAPLDQVTIGAGTASRTCPDTYTCDYVNLLSVTSVQYCGGLINPFCGISP